MSKIPRSSPTSFIAVPVLVASRVASAADIVETAAEAGLVEISGVIHVTDSVM